MVRIFNRTGNAVTDWLMNICGFSFTFAAKLVECALLRVSFKADNAKDRTSAACDPPGLNLG